MVYIQGWEQARDGSTVWVSKTATIDVGKGIYFSKKGVEFTNKRYVLNITKDGIVKFNKQFPTEKQAVSFAMKFMRSHPNG